MNTCIKWLKLKCVLPWLGDKDFNDTIIFSILEIDERLTKIEQILEKKHG